MRDKKDRLLEQKRKIEEEIRRIEARTREKDRKDETRRKILAGAIVLDRAKADAAFSDQLMAWLDGALQREADRALFELKGGTNDAEARAGEAVESMQDLPTTAAAVTG